VSAEQQGSPLDLGFGNGEFVAACLKLGYSILAGADLGIHYKEFIRVWTPDRITLCAIRDNVGEFFSERNERDDFIPMSHVLEHVPKCSWLWIVDSLDWALKPGGTIRLLTPNLEGPAQTQVCM